MEFLPELSEVPTAAILEFDALQSVPDALGWVQVRRIAGQPFEMQPCGRAGCQEVFDRLTFVDRSAIPDDEDFAADLAQQLAQKAHDSLVHIRLFLLLQEQTPVEGEPADDREMVAGEGHVQHRGVPAWRPGAG